jgi:hypothetical protein
MTAVRAMIRSHPEKPSHTDTIDRCIDACLLMLDCLCMHADETVWRMP